MPGNRSVAFFERQFRQQVAAGDFALNPFESAVLPFLRGSVLDFGCGLGNLAIQAARSGHATLAVDGSHTAVEHVQRVARDEGLPLRATQADLRGYREAQVFDSVVSIGLLMFFDCPTALRQVDYLKSLARPGGIVAINVLTENTTFMDMFSPEGHCLFRTGELARLFEGWEILLNEASAFPAPRSTTKEFNTLVARHPGFDRGIDDCFRRASASVEPGT
jgi:tellurite methyltransferase